MEDIQLYNGDCLEIMKDIPDKSIDMIITDPPYGVDFSKGFNDKTDYVKENLPLWVNELYRVLKETCHCFVFMPTKQAGLFITKFEKKFTLMNILSTRTYTTNSYLNNNFTFNSQLILYLSKGKAKKFNKVDFVETSNAWLNDKRNKNPHKYTYQYPSFFPNNIFSNQKTNKINSNNNGRHPCEKSIGFEEILIKLSSNENDTILDPFMGSGTTGIACKNLNRKFIGIELDKQYFEIAKDRINNK